MGITPMAMADDHHHDEVRTIDTGHGVVELSIFEDGVPPRWRLRTLSGNAWRAEDVLVETERPDGSRERLRFRGARRIPGIRRGDPGAA